MTWNRILPVSFLSLTHSQSMHVLLSFNAPDRCRTHLLLQHLCSIPMLANKSSMDVMSKGSNMHVCGQAKSNPKENHRPILELGITVCQCNLLQAIHSKGSFSQCFGIPSIETYFSTVSLLHLVNTTWHPMNPGTNPDSQFLLQSQIKFIHDSISARKNEPQTYSGRKPYKLLSVLWCA